ncbi:MAG: hypothetical protein DMG96_23375 [Acidobacteria bacterium]|nr:MAG: hypothetical protein DMG96_23375 [Acidobacteriota bacterium]
MTFDIPLIDTSELRLVGLKKKSVVVVASQEVQMTSARSGFAGLLLTASFLLSFTSNATALPAFARKYGLRCSACHEAWPMLNYFGQKFKDNGYQLMNDRDSPVWQNPSYWPVTFRMTPFWHRESTDKITYDTPGGGSALRRLTFTGFDYGGLDILSAGTIEKNISFQIIPASDELGSFHIEAVNARLDNLFHSPWLNFKFGKFELDNIVSEKRGLTLSASGGGYNLYHFIPAGDGNMFGQLGDNQIGVEWMGHSANDRTRLSVAVLSSTDGNPDVPYGSNSYTTFITGSHAFNVGKLGTDRVGFYAMVGEAATTFLTDGGVPLPNSGVGNKGFSREGFVGLFYFNKLNFQVVTQHGSDSPWFGAGFGNPIDDPSAPNFPVNTLPAGFRNPTWNGAFVETHWVHSPQLIFFQRSEWIRMSQQADPTAASNLGNLDNYVFGYRYYPIMNSRAGFAWHNEYSWIRQRGGAPDGTDLTSNSLMLGFDFDF